MTVNELIARLQRLPVEERDLEVRVWLPGSHISLDGTPVCLPSSNLAALPIVIVEGNLVPGSALYPDADEDITF